MVKIAIAGGSGEVAREIVDGLVAANRHDILLLSRKDPATLPVIPGAHWVQVDYTSKHQLTESLHGVQTVMSFITSSTDPNEEAQKNLIDASIQAGVARFAPSEWATSGFEHMNWYAGKAKIREYLRKVNEHQKVLEYTLFQPGLFLNYFTHPYPSAKYLSTFEIQIDFQNRRAIVSEDFEDVKITLTTVQDLVNVVVKAVDYTSEWPIVGGIKGCEMSIGQLIRLAEDIRGKAFDIEKLRLSDLRAGNIKSTWRPTVSHPSIPPEQVAALADSFLVGMTLGISAGNLNVSDEWNQLFPDYVFTQPEKFLMDAWENKP